MRTTCNVTQKDNKTILLNGIFQDITEQKTVQRKLEMSNANLAEANAALQLSAHYDALTELPNRILLSDRLQHAMTKSIRNNKTLAIAFIDIDGFKVINDSYGHSAGDEFLKQISAQLKGCLREGDTLARIGGDEFVAVLDELNDPSESHVVLSRMLKAAAAEMQVFNHQLQVSASIGVTFYPENNGSADQLLRYADQAMYSAKQLGKNRWHVFDIDKDVAVKHKHEELERLRLALKNDEYVLFYQPKINLKDNKLTGFEALIRWDHPDKGILAPFYFLPVLENDVLGIEIGNWVIKTALEQMKDWWDTPLDVPISVNISPMHLQHPDFVSNLKAILAKYPNYRSNTLEFEILESSALKDIDLITDIIHQCNKLGVIFSIDDFGTGYSSLTYLKKLPTKYLKIDQSFVKDMMIDTDNKVIIQGIIELSKAFNLDVIAEGVETPTHAEELLLLGCYLAQGYGISRPMMASSVSKWHDLWLENPVLIDGS